MLRKCVLFLLFYLTCDVIISKFMLIKLEESKRNIKPNRDVNSYRSYNKRLQSMGINHDYSETRYDDTHYNERMGHTSGMLFILM